MRNPVETTERNFRVADGPWATVYDVPVLMITLQCINPFSHCSTPHNFTHLYITHGTALC